ncbi:MAG: acyltransferase [Proteobacteria bacterium]|nr:acyltransferase [Pseudomonadota bacterium]
MGIERFVKNIRRGESPLYKGIKRTTKDLLRFELPVIPGVHDALYWEYRMRHRLWRNLTRAVYYQPIFRSRCKSCGDKLMVVNSGQGLPLIVGDVDVEIGDNIKMHDKTTIIGLTVGGTSRLTIGDNTEISRPPSIFIGDSVSIGKNCLIGCTLIADNPGHQIDYRERGTKALDAGAVGRIVIGDHVWAALDSIIVGNVTVGTGAIIAARTVVTRDVPPFCLVAGSPGRIAKKLDFPEEMIDILGEEEHRKYLDAQVGK